MKINDLNTLGNMVRTGAPMETHIPAQSGPTFRAAMQGVNRQNAESVLTDMSTRIAQQGDILGRRVDILELKRFKEMVTEYLNEAVRYMYEFKKQSTFDARGRHRLYAIIKKINEKLEKLTREVLTQQAEPLELLAAIGEIRGLLIDIML